MHLRCRGAHRVRPMSKSGFPRAFPRGWRAEKRNPMARALRHAGASRRASMCALFGALPRFALLERRAQLSPLQAHAYLRRSHYGTGPRFPLPAYCSRAVSQLLTGTR